MQRYLKTCWLFGQIFLLVIFSIVVISQETGDIKIEEVAGNTYCLYGQGGNIGILVTTEGKLVIDSQYARSAETVLTAIRELSDQKIRYLINTHYHGDHTGGNAVIGSGAEIYSHLKCQESFLAGLKAEDDPASKGAPQLTFEKDAVLQLGNTKVQLRHFGPGHTAGDTVVIIGRDKVIHAGDLFFFGIPPYIDVKNGADTKNWVLTIRKLAEKYPDYQVIPGHGPVTDMKAFLKFAEYIEYLRLQVQASILAGKTEEETLAAIDLGKFSHIKDQGGFLTKENNIRWIYTELKGK